MKKKNRKRKVTTKRWKGKVKKRELKKIQKKVKEKGMTIVPLRLFKNEKGLIKIEIGLATGKKLHDKRNAIKEKDLKNRDRGRREIGKKKKEERKRKRMTEKK